MLILDSEDGSDKKSGRAWAARTKSGKQNAEMGTLVYEPFCLILLSSTPLEMGQNVPPESGNFAVFAVHYAKLTILSPLNPSHEIKAN
jgi:hypothetical protein